MPIKFRGGKKLSFGELVWRLMQKKRKGSKRKMSRKSAERLAGWIQSHGPGVKSSPHKKDKRRGKKAHG